MTVRDVHSIQLSGFQLGEEGAETLLFLATELPHVPLKAPLLLTAGGERAGEQLSWLGFLQERRARDGRFACR